MVAASFTNLIVTYNNAKDILNLLADLQEGSPASRIIVIDNASTDQTARLVCKNHPEVQLIRNSRNVGYARAVNQGFDLCDTEYVLLLNPDIRITRHRVFSVLEACLKNSRWIAAAAPLQFKSDEGKRHLNFTWSHVTQQAFRVYVACFFRQRKSFRNPIQVTFLNAGCLFIHKSAFYQVGKLNEKYFLYGEEPDLFLKFKRYGFKCYLLPNVDVTHYRERSLGTVPLLARLRIRLQAALNVMDALVVGWAHILSDKLTVQRPKKMERS